VGFKNGADDYIKKPFDADELIIRIKSQIKKSFRTYSLDISYKDIVYNIESHSIVKNGEKISLTPVEIKLFELFMKNIGKPILKEDILYHIHNGDEGSEASLRVHISRLKKIGLEIINQRSVGYKLEKL
jgi:DNA-binding response OmpR family regulator